MASARPAIETENRSRVNIAVYSCITRGYDTLKTPLFTDDRISYFCFTDNPAIVTPPWVFRTIDLEELSPKDQNRYIKMHPHEFLPGYDITVYVDGSIQIVGDLYALVCKAINLPEDMFLYEHPYRKCAFAEAAACIHYAHDWIWTIAAQMNRYRKEGYPINYGLFEANVMIRKNTAVMQSLMHEWWYEYRSGSKRDQLSLPYMAWRSGVLLGSLGESDPRFGHQHFLLVKRVTEPSLKLIIRKHINRSIAFIASYEKLFGLTAPISWK